MEQDPEDVIAEIIDNLNGLIDELSFGEIDDATTKLDEIEKSIATLRSIIVTPKKDT